MLIRISLFSIQHSASLNSFIFRSENGNTRDKELVEGDMKFSPGQTRGSISDRLWPNGVIVYDIDESLRE